MGKLNKSELLEGVRNIIQESFNRDTENFDGTTKFNIHRYVNGLIEEGHKNPELMSYLINYNNALANGAQDFMLFEQFGQGLAKYAKGNKSIKSVIEQMNNTLATDGANLVGYQLIEQIENPLTKDNIKYLYNQYVANKCQETKDNLVEALSPLVEDGDPVATKLNILLTEESSMSANFIHADYVNESEVKNFEKKLQEQRDKKTMDQIFSKVQRYIDEKLDEDEKARLTEKDDFCLNAIANNQGINLSEHINNIRHSDASSNQRLMEVINLYSNAINQGAYEERLYETFLQNVSKFNYLLPVSKAMKSITEKVDSKREEITLTKILEEMKDDHSSFIYVDLIQEDVARYVKEPNAINRVQLRNALMPYASDPYINEMFNVIYSDNSRRANELTEKALNIKDQINIIRENASVSNIYTPVQYVKENEAIFNVNGQFYVKKGNNIAVLEDKLVDQLDERFVELCRLVNDPHVEINEDHIILHSNDKYATIFEGYVDIYGHKESKETLRNLREMCMKYDDYDTNFYIMCSCLLENFNNIAKIDWAKHVTLNENNNINADLFKLDQNIFIATHNDAIGQHTFYRNVNPIFCKNKLNEHMGINVSSLFSDLLPSQDKIILKLNETKNQYEDSIEKYEDMIEKLNKALESASDENKEKLEKAIADAEEKLDDIKAEYKEWQKQVDDVTGEDNSDDTDDDETTDDGTVTKENPNEPMSDEEVDASKDELSQPLSGEDGDSEATDNFDDEESDEGITDDEFAKFLGSDSDDDSDDDDSDDEKEMPWDYGKHFEGKKSRKTMKESKERKEVLFEVDLGYTDNYQDEDPISGLSNNEPSKSGKSWEKGVPTGTAKPWAVKSNDKGKPFEKTVNEEEADECGAACEKEPVVDESTTTSIRGQRDMGTKKHIPAPRKENGPKAKHHVSTEGNYEEVVEAYKRENKALKECILKLRNGLQEARITNVNLAKVAKLFVENTVSKEEKINILNRFDKEAKTIEQSNALYESINKELNKATVKKNLTLENTMKSESSNSINENKSKDLLNTLDLIRRIENC